MILSKLTGFYNLCMLLFKEAYKFHFATNYSQLIIETIGLTQVLVVSELDIEEESHANEYESFLILKGKCRCTVDRHVFYLNQADIRKYLCVQIIGWRLLKDPLWPLSSTGLPFNFCSGADRFSAALLF